MYGVFVEYGYFCCLYSCDEMRVLGCGYVVGW